MENTRGEDREMWYKLKKDIVKNGLDEVDTLDRERRKQKLEDIFGSEEISALNQSIGNSLENQYNAISNKK